MPRIEGEAWDRDEIDVLLEEILATSDPVKDALRDPQAALELLQRGDLTGAEADQLRVRAREALENIERMNHLDAIGAVTTSPRSAVEATRARRAEDAGGWRRVLEAMER